MQYEIALTYSYSGCRWYGNPTYKVVSNMGTSSSCNEFMTSGNSYRNDFNCALKAWNDLDVSYLTMYNATDDDGDVNSYNWESEVAFVSDLDDGALGITWNNCWFGEIYESDITFDAYPDAGDPWVIGAPAPSIESYQNINAFRAIALHEIGHGRGLNHYNARVATMNKFYPAGGWYRGNNYGALSSYFGRFWPHPDDVAGDRSIYPNSTAVGRDLAVLRAVAPISGRAFDVDPVLPNNSIYSFLCPGEYLTIEYTVENRGNETVDAEVWGVLSTNNWISPIDIRLDYSLHTLTPYNHQQLKRDFTLPTSVPPGEYYVGIYVDPDDYIVDEKDEYYNNGVSLPVVSYGNAKVSVLPLSSTLCQ